MKKLKNLFGVGPLGIVIIILMAVVLLETEYVLNLEKIILNEYSILLVAFLLIVGLIITIFSFVSLPPSNRGKHLITKGTYKYVRHPIYSAIIFLFYPAIALLLNSWLMLVSTIFVYVIFKIVVRYEEKYLIEIFGDEYRKYMKKVPQFIPRLS